MHEGDIPILLRKNRDSPLKRKSSTRVMRVEDFVLHEPDPIAFE